MKIVDNDRYESGMTTSIQEGVKKAKGNAYMICLSDMPLLNPSDYNTLIHNYQSCLTASKDILLPYFEGKRANPVIFHSSYKDAILNHKEANGCSGIVKQHMDCIIPFDVGNDHFALDIDTLSDYHKVLSKEELIRYNRQIILPNFGLEGQEKLKASKVLIIGAGGLGIPNISYLAAAGVGEIGIVEFDEISLTNLQRQVIYSSTDIGKSKVLLAKERINQLNPNVKVQVFETTISAANAMEIISTFDLVVDGSDNLPTRYLVNDACVLLNKPLVYAAIFRYEGQVSVFNQLQADGSRGPNYRDLFPTPPPPHMVPSCNEGG
uniref:ThiF family adenylyltransferase n=1 Tax=Roseivirga sp. TaxID=1964215 RepID=UPI0040487AB2